jgi:hypothetical protein
MFQSSGKIPAPFLALSNQKRIDGRLIHPVVPRNCCDFPLAGARQREWPVANRRDCPLPNPTAPPTRIEHLTLKRSCCGKRPCRAGQRDSACSRKPRSQRERQNLFPADDDVTRHSWVDRAKVFELPGGFEFVRETSVRIERLRGERTIHFGDFVRFLVLVNPDDLRTHRNHQIAWAEFKILDCDRIGPWFARAGRRLCRVQSGPGREQGGDG